LTVAERAQARTHLDSCLDCGARLVAARRLDADLRDAGRLSCASILPLLSAIADNEATTGERPLVAAHIADCPDCRLLGSALRTPDRLVASLPAARPSAQVDAFVAALAHPRPRAAFRPVTFAFRGAGAIALAVLIAIGSTLFQAGAPSADQAQSTEVAMVAAIQRVVFDTRTNTLYLLDAQRAEVSAVDATTQIEQARVSVGGRPTALALSPSTNRVLVLDATSKRLTEIDTTSHTIVATSTLAVTGTPTSLQVDQTSGKIVVASVSAAASNATPAAVVGGGATGHVSFIDPVSKQVESVRAVDVAPQLVVLDAKGAQALLLSARETTLVDATTYKSVDQLPGGVAAAFDVTGTQLAVLSADGETSKVTFRGAGLPASLALAGRPVALIAMPGGGFAALVDRGSAGEIDVIDLTGHVLSTSAVVLAGHSLTYDAAAARFAVGGDNGQALAFSGSSTVAVTAPPTTAPSTQPSATEPAATASAKPSASAPSSSAPAVAIAGPSGIPPAAQLRADGTYRLGLTDNRRPTLIAGSGRTLWFLDEARRLATIDTTTGAVTDVAQLSPDGTFTRLLMGTAHVYAIDQGKGRISVVTRSTGRLETIGFPFVTTAAGFAIGTDDKLWMAGGESNSVLALDPLTKRVAAINFQTSSISALFVDSAARVWYADDASGGIGYYDQTKQSIVTVSTPRHASVTSLAMDRDGTLWAGTQAGEVVSVRLGVPSPQAGSAGGPVAALFRDDSGGIWSYAPALGTAVYRSLTMPGQPHISAVGASGLGFDGAGRAWLAVPADGAFYIAINEER